MEFNRHLAYFRYSKITYEISGGRNSNVYRDGLIEADCNRLLFSVSKFVNTPVVKKENERWPTYSGTPNAPKKATLVGR